MSELVTILVPIAFATVIGVIGFLLRYIDTLKTRDMERRLAELQAANAKLEAALVAALEKIGKVGEQLHANDKETIRLQGELKLLQQNHGGLDRDLRDLKETMQEGFASIDRKLGELAGRGPGRYAYPSPAPPSGGSSPRNEVVKR